MKNIQSTKTAKMNEFIKATVKKTVRIYIDKYSPQKLTHNKLKQIDQYYKNTIQYTQLFSLDGIFRIENNQLVRINIIDKPIINRTDYYDNHVLLVDESIVEKEPILSQIPYEHLVTNVVIHQYNLSTAKEPKLTLFIEGTYDNEMLSIQASNRYVNFKPTNLYFLAIEDIDHLLIKQELVELLSVLI